MLVFRDQAVSDDQQMAFTRNFGAIENARGGNVTKDEDKRLANGMNDVSNLGKDGRPLARDSRQRCSTWATCCGTPTVPSAPFPPSIRCFRRAW